MKTTSLKYQKAKRQYKMKTVRSCILTPIKYGTIKDWDLHTKEMSRALIQLAKMAV